jgi:cyclase
MKKIRIIPRLDIKDNFLVKGIHLEGLRILGKPEDFALEYYKNGADEIIYQDVVASLYGKNSLLDQIQKVNENIFIPLTVGGGIRSIQDIKKILKAGADKVAINTAAVKNPNLISQAAQIFGSSTIIVAVEVSKNKKNEYEVFTDNGREKTKWNARDWVKVIEKKGAGEIFLTSIDNDGTGKNFDFNLVNEISKNVGIPVICHGGGSNIEDIIKVSSKTEISGISLASMLHYNLIFFNKKFRKQAFSINDNLLRISNISLKKKMFKNNLKDLKQLMNKKFISRNI